MGQVTAMGLVPVSAFVFYNNAFQTGGITMWVQVPTGPSGDRP